MVSPSPKKKLLDEYLALLEEAKRRDHRKIGKEMELFMFSELVGKGLPMWLPKGTALRLAPRRLLEEDSEEVWLSTGDHAAHRFEDLYVTSGHYAKYGKELLPTHHHARRRGRITSSSP